MRVLGIDLGTKRIGVALSDPKGAVAFPFSVIETRGREKDLARLKEIIESTRAEAVVVGMPVTLRGESGLAAKAVAEFVQELAKQIDVPVTTWDERMTTVVAERALVQAGARQASRRDKRDKLAAAVMLQSYLDAQHSR